MAGKKNAYRKQDRRSPLIACESLKGVEPHCRKKRHATHGIALVAMHKLYKAQRKAKSRRGKMNVYFCTTCDGWHVGHDKPWIKGPRN